MTRYRCSNSECARAEEFLAAEEVASIGEFGGALYHAVAVQGRLLDPVVGLTNVVRIGAAVVENFPLPCGPVLAIDGPCRIRLRRRKGWRKPTGVIVCTRPGRFGNPLGAGAADAAEWFAVGMAMRRAGTLPQDHALWAYPSDESIRRYLGGWDLACWCRLDADCHVDTVLMVANSEPEP